MFNTLQLFQLASYIELVPRELFAQHCSAKYFFNYTLFSGSCTYMCTIIYRGGVRGQVLRFQPDHFFSPATPLIF